MELQGMAVAPCGQPASVKHGGYWVCEFHFDAMEFAKASPIACKSRNRNPYPVEHDGGGTPR
jgi:hypothetical protein